MRSCRTTVLLLVLAVAWLGPAATSDAATEATAGLSRVVRVDEWLVHTPEAHPMDASRVVAYEGLPDTAVVFSGPYSVLMWRPTADDIGEHIITEVRRFGASEQRTRITVQVRAEPTPTWYVAMGDSVATGHGLQRRDFLGLDPCWRDPDGSYPRRVLEAIGDNESELFVVACSGFTSSQLITRPVDGGPSSIGGSRPQLDWVLRSNPGLITLTIGANDLGFDSPNEFFVGGELRADLVSTRIRRLRVHLAQVLAEIVAGTDSTVVVTTVHNPTSPDPHGVPGCRRSCFAAAADAVVAELNAAISAEVARQAPRVRLADVSPLFVGHGSANGRGPDWLRAGDNWLTRRLPIPTRGVHPFCEEGHSSIDTWINTADCVHPNGEGAQAYADVVVQALDGRWP